MKNSIKLLAVAFALTAAVACSGNKTAETTEGTDTTTVAPEVTEPMVDTTATMAPDTTVAPAADTTAH